VHLALLPLAGQGQLAAEQAVSTTQSTAQPGCPVLAPGIPRAGTHAMRHPAPTIALEQGIALAVVQEMLGHSDIRVARLCAHLIPLAEAAAATMGARRQLGWQPAKPDLRDMIADAWAFTVPGCREASDSE
jgi:hypothetical protein